MPSDFVCNIEIEVFIPSWMDATEPLKDIAKKVENDCKQNIRMQHSPDGTPFIPLSRQTIKRKGFSAALIDKGILLSSIHSYSPYKNTVIVGVKSLGKPRRDYLARIHQEEGVKSKEYGRITRPFLGMSDKTRQWANKRMVRWMKENIEKATKKYINFRY